MKKIKLFLLLTCLVVPFFVSGCENTNKNTLSTPKIYEISGGTIVFNPVKSAEYYTISINDNEFNVSPKYSPYVKIVDNRINYNANKIFTKGESYTIKIKANAENCESSQYSSTYSYKHSGSVSKPNNVKINSTILTWDAVENASYYLVKMVTPNDRVIVDKDGNPLNVVTAENIAKADLTEYSFNTNNFNFASLLTDAGRYEFYVCAVLQDASSYVESEYTSKLVYTHNLNLETPTTGKVYKVENELHMLLVLDPNANAVSLSCNGIEKTVEINNSEQSIVRIDANCYDINLSKYFASYVASGVLDLNDYKNHTFTTQAKYLSSNLNNYFYLDSAISSDIVFENTYQLTAPSVKVEKTKDNYEISWTTEEKSLVGSYKVIVCTPTLVKEYSLNSDVFSLIVTDEVIGVSVQAIGKGNYLTSNVGEFISPESLTRDLNISHNSSFAPLRWTSITDAYFLVVIGDTYVRTTTSSYSINLAQYESKRVDVKIVGIKSEYKATTITASFTCSSQLNQPTFGYDQGFNSTNIYELTFTGVNNAIGYYVYIKGKDLDEYVKIDRLYTSTTIDLSKYIVSEGEFTDYEVMVQAIADPHSFYTDSELSVPKSVSHIQVLRKPEFVKVNGIDTPIVKQVVGGSTKYILQFRSVTEAASYEILVNYNRISVEATMGTTLYEVDVTNYLTAANNYEIKVRAIPSESAYNSVASEYNIANYLLSKQLPMVDNIVITENEGVYTLSFKLVDNAESYRIRIVKENDSEYLDYLHEIGLSNLINVTQSTDITNYVKQQGVYYFYVTALAPSTNSYYADANESLTYATLSKLNTLLKPTSIGYDNVSSSNYILHWTGDENADYYRIRLTDPNNIEYEFTSFSAQADINQYMTIPGDYQVSIYSMVSALSDNAKTYASSPATDYTWRYSYAQEKDFLRYSVSLYGTSENFVVDTVSQLKHQLWYHYLYGTGTEGLTIMVKNNLETSEYIREQIVNWSIEATELNLYNFTGTNDADILLDYNDQIDTSSGDTVWCNMVYRASGTTDTNLFKYLCEKLLGIYPELNSLQNLNVRMITKNSNYATFNLTYSNGLNGEKTTAPAGRIYNLIKDYGNEYKYIDLYARKSPTGAFAIDSREEALVTTTEQLIQIVQHNKKPKFIGNSATAELVYSNAKLVLSAIISNNMSDLEKVTAIFDWLEANYQLTYYNIESKIYVSDTLEHKDINTYGKYKYYYLEGIFENITMEENGNLVIGSNLATSRSYSKAFALLCAIEGIDSIIVNGTYDYFASQTSSTETANHTWNKVKISTTNDNNKRWYVVDVAFSDNRIYFNQLPSSYGISSHTHFLVSDGFVQKNDQLQNIDNSRLVLNELSHLISNEYKARFACTTEYNYYSNSSFGLTYTEINSTIKNFEDAMTRVKGFNYSKQFYDDADDGSQYYQRYKLNPGYGEIQSFLLNAMIYTQYMANHNESKRSAFEFSFLYSNNNGSANFDMNSIYQVFEECVQYGIKAKCVYELGRSVYSVKNLTRATIVFVVDNNA